MIKLKSNLCAESKPFDWGPYLIASAAQAAPVSCFKHVSDMYTCKYKSVLEKCERKRNGGEDQIFSGCTCLKKPEK